MKMVSKLIVLKVILEEDIADEENYIISAMKISITSIQKKFVWMI
jgi:hypothetical protein